MKAFRGTAIFAALVLLLAGYSAWEYRKAEMHSGDTAQEKRLFFFVPEEVRDIKLTRGSETVLVVREGDEWKMKQPVEDVAEKSAVEAFLYSVMIQKGRSFRDSDEAKNPKWSDFGLEPPGAVIEINTGKKTETLAVSSKNAYDGSYFIRQGDDLMLGDRGLAQIVGRDASTLRSKRLWRDNESVIQVATVEVNHEALKDKFSVKKVGDRWAIDPTPKFPVDSHKIEMWFMALHALQPSDVASETLSEEQTRDFLLLKPSFGLRVALKDKAGKDSAWDLTVGQDRGDEVFLYSNQRPTVYKTSAGSLASLRVSREYFRDGKAPFQFPVEQAHEIEFGGMHIIKDGSVWKLKDAPAGQELSQEKLASLLQNLTQLEAQSFPPVKNAKGFKPAQKILIKDSQGKTLLDFGWGDEYKAPESWNKGMTFRFVKTNLEKEVLGVNSAKITSLQDPGLVIKRAEKKTEKTQ